MSRGKIAPTLVDYFGEGKNGPMNLAIFGACQRELRALLAVARAARGLTYEIDGRRYVVDTNRAHKECVGLERALSRLARASGGKR